MGENATLLLNNLVNIQCKHIIKNLEEGELCIVIEEMLILLGLITCQHNDLSYTILQIKNITMNNNIIYINNIRNIIKNFIQCIQLFIKLIKESNSIIKQIKNISLTIIEENEINKINKIYLNFSLYIKQIKILLIDLLNNNQYSELQLLSNYLFNLLYQLYELPNRTHTIFNINNSGYREYGIINEINKLNKCLHILYYINTTLYNIEITYTLELFISLIKQDFLSLYSYNQNLIKTLNFSNYLINNKEKNTTNNNNTTTNNNNNLLITHNFKELPKNFSDIISYAIDRLEYCRNNHINIINNNYSTFIWKSLNISNILQNQLINNNKLNNNNNNKRNNEDELKIFQENLKINNQMKNLHEYSNIWDFYAILGEYK